MDFTFRNVVFPPFALPLTFFFLAFCPPPVKIPKELAPPCFPISPQTHVLIFLSPRPLFKNAVFFPFGRSCSCGLANESLILAVLVGHPQVLPLSRYFVFLFPTVLRYTPANPSHLVLFESRPPLI